MLDRLNQMVWGKGTDLISTLKSDIVAVPLEKGRYVVSKEKPQAKMERIEKVALKNAILACGGYWNYISHDLESTENLQDTKTRKFEIISKGKLGEVDTDTNVIHPYTLIHPSLADKIKSGVINTSALFAGVFFPPFLFGPIHGILISMLVLAKATHSHYNKIPHTDFRLATRSETSEIKFSKLRCRQLPQLYKPMGKPSVEVSSISNFIHEKFLSKFQPGSFQSFFGGQTHSGKAK